MKKYFYNSKPHIRLLCLCSLMGGFTFTCNAMLSSPGSVNEDLLISGRGDSVPLEGSLLSNFTESDTTMLSNATESDTTLLSVGLDTSEEAVLLSGGEKEKPEDAPEFTYKYIYDTSVADRLDLSLDTEVVSGALAIGDYSFHSSMGETQKSLNLTLASIYDKYVQETNIPLKDPLWLIAIGSVEYNYSTNDSGLIFSFPVNITKASSDPNYLLAYDWREVQDSFGTSAVLRRDGRVYQCRET